VESSPRSSWRQVWHGSWLLGSIGSRSPFQV